MILHGKSKVILHATAKMCYITSNVWHVTELLHTLVKQMISENVWIIIFPVAVWEPPVTFLTIMFSNAKKCLTSVQNLFLKYLHLCVYPMRDACWRMNPTFISGNSTLWTSHDDTLATILSSYFKASLEFLWHSLIPTVTWYEQYQGMYFYRDHNTLLINVTKGL